MHVLEHGSPTHSASSTEAAAVQCHKVQLPNDDTIHSEVVLEGHFVSSGFAVGSSRIEISVTQVEEVVTTDQARRRRSRDANVLCSVRALRPVRGPPQVLYIRGRVFRFLFNTTESLVRMILHAPD